VPNLLLFGQTLLEVLNFLAEQVVHLQLFLYYCLQFFDVGVNIKVDIPYALDLRNQFTLLGEQLSVFFDSRHVSGEYLFLLFQNVGYFLLEGEVLFAHIVVL
jgi:hypothetical protein